MKHKLTPKNLKQLEQTIKDLEDEAVNLKEQLMQVEDMLNSLYSLKTVGENATKT